MKKTLAAVAVLGAFAGSALAADVQLYGIVDTGLRYTHFDADSAAAGYDATDSFGMQSGNQSGSRFGFKGTEDLGNGLTVGFILENQFNSDDGSLADEDHFFRRESSLFLQGGFGKVAMGRMGSINGGTSSWAKYGVLSAFGTSWDYSAQAGSWAIGGGMWDNMIAYETPDFAGFKVFAQYGMGTNDAENESRSDRYYAIGASYANGPLNLYFAVDSINYQTADANGALANASDIDDSLTITFGGNYDFEVLKLFAGAQYFDEIKRTLRILREQAEAYGMHAVVEVFDESDLAIARESGARIIQVNARDLDTLKTDRQACLEMGKLRREGEVWIAASAMSAGAHLREAVEAGFQAVLMGTALMDGGKPGEKLAAILEETT